MCARAALASRARQAFLGRPDQPRRPVGDGEQWIPEPAPAHVLVELPAARRVLLGAGRQVQQDLLALQRDAPGRQHRLAGLAQMQPLGDPVDEQIQQVELRQIATRERLVILPQPLAELAHRRLAEQQTPLVVGEGRLDVAHAQAAREHRFTLDHPPLRIRQIHF